jgi:hypothetical protein
MLKYNDPLAKCSLHFFKRIRFRLCWNSTCETCVVKVDTLSVAVDNNEVTPQPPHPPQIPSASVCCWERETTVLIMSYIEACNESHLSHFIYCEELVMAKV